MERVYGFSGFVDFGEICFIDMGTWWLTEELILKDEFLFCNQKSIKSRLESAPCAFVGERNINEPTGLNWNS